MTTLKEATMSMKAITALILGWVSVGATLLVTQPALAQLGSERSSSVFPQNNATDLDFLTTPGGNGGSSMLSLINRLRSLDGRNLQQFSADQAEGLDAAAAKFRAEQLQQLQQQTPLRKPSSAPTN